MILLRIPVSKKFKLFEAFLSKSVSAKLPYLPALLLLLVFLVFSFGKITKR
jgi:hypothetical protein